MKSRKGGNARMWARHFAQWRDPAQICSQWREASELEPRLLKTEVSGRWWEILAQLQITLLITREYEHLLMAASAPKGTPVLSFLPMPHPSGLAIDRAKKTAYVASTRNPNQVYALRPAAGALPRRDSQQTVMKGSPLVPVTSVFFPGCLYLHDLAIIGERLYANAVGHNAIVRLGSQGTFERVWWPRCVERRGKPEFSCNHIQLNSIAAGKTLRDSFFSASSAEIARFRPGHLAYKVDGRGVIFSGRTREPVCQGLTRPHSARLKGRQIWVDNSGYGEVGVVESGRFGAVCRLPGWTRGLGLNGDIAFVATSRVIPKYACYAPGLDGPKSKCGVHAVSCSTGAVLGSMLWPNGNQIFAVDWISNKDTTGLPFHIRSRRRQQEIAFFYSYLTDGAT